MDDVRLFAPAEIFQNSNPNKFEVNHLQWNFLCLSTVAKQNLDDLWSELLNHSNFVSMSKCSMDLAKRIVRNVILILFYENDFNVIVEFFF